MHIYITMKHLNAVTRTETKPDPARAKTHVYRRQVKTCPCGRVWTTPWGSALKVKESKS